VYFAGNPISVRTHTEWTINVHLNTQSNQPVTQPVIQTTWYVDGGLDNVVPADTPYTVRIPLRRAVIWLGPQRSPAPDHLRERALRARAWGGPHSGHEPVTERQGGMSRAG
jgi:hypothetical protein